VIPSLDAGCKDVFESVNRPCPELKFEKMVDGLEQFSREFCGKIWLEIFILGGIMDPYANLKGIPDLVKQISPTAVQLNTIARPPCEKYAQGVSRNVLEDIARLFTPNAEIIADFREPDNIQKKSVARERHPESAGSSSMYLF
jgi:wyosine [tRNA(Phe)-imidazoG37] synthetase (radical SAM superfamily)